MTAARDELRHLINELTESDVSSEFRLVRDRLPRSTEIRSEDYPPLPEWVGMLRSGKGDLGARSGEILREELGRRQA